MCSAVKVKPLDSALQEALWFLQAVGPREERSSSKSVWRVKAGAGWLFWDSQSLLESLKKNGAHSLFMWMRSTYVGATQDTYTAWIEHCEDWTHFSMWSRLLCRIWQVHVIESTMEVWWEDSMGVFRDQRSFYCLAFIGSLTLQNFLCFFCPCSDCSTLREESMMDLREDYKTSIMTNSFKLMNLGSTLTRIKILIRAVHHLIGKILI